MYQLIVNPRLKFSRLAIIVWLVAMPFGFANEDLEVGRKSKELVDEMKRKEGELREETQKKIKEMRELALQHLEKARNQFLAQKKLGEADIIAKEINQLRSKLGMPPLANPEIVKKDDVKVSNDQKSNHFKFNTSYKFNDEGLIQGKMIFMPNQKVKINYSYKGKETSEDSDWKDMGDHVLIQSNSILGETIISTSPSSNQKSLLIRWGGELTNKLTDAQAE